MITIRTIPHSEQRYNTVGDWEIHEGAYDPQDSYRISVSRLPDHRYELLVGLHELVEAILCREHGITQERVDAFDKAFTGDGEPGDDPAAPYRREHFSATAIERLMAAELGVDWAEYEKAIEAL